MPFRRTRQQGFSIDIAALFACNFVFLLTPHKKGRAKRRGKSDREEVDRNAIAERFQSPIA